MVGSCTFPLPSDEEDRLALQYQLLLKFYSSEVPWFDFCIRAFGSLGFDEAISDLNSQVISKFVRDIGYRLDELLENLPETGPITSEQLIIFEHHDYHVSIGNMSGGTIALATGGSNATVLVREHNDDLSEELKTVLRSAVGEIEAHGEILSETARALEELERRVTLHIALEDGGRRELIEMMEDLWVNSVRQDFRPRARKMLEGSLPKVIWALLARVASS